MLVYLPETAAVLKVILFQLASMKGVTVKEIHEDYGILAED